MNVGDVGILIRAIEARRPVGDDEKRALVSLDWKVERFSQNDEIIPYGSKPSRSCLLIDGYLARSIVTATGDRQIASVHVAGDFVDLHGLLLNEMDHSVLALTSGSAAFIDHDDLFSTMERFPPLNRALFMLIAIDAAIQRNWTVSLGRRQADRRLAGLFCELLLRLEIVGLSSQGAFEFPVSQVVLADILGLSLVHTNRILKSVRQEGLIDWSDGVVSVLQPRRLARVAQFDPIYLNLRAPAGAPASWPFG